MKSNFFTPSGSASKGHCPYPGGPEGPISVFGKFNLWAKVILKNNNDEEYLLTNESALGKITKG